VWLHLTLKHILQRPKWSWALKAQTLLLATGTLAQMEPLMKYTNAQECHQYLVVGDQGSIIHGVQCVEQGHLQTRF
jgi:hypothetical protein